MRSARLGSMAGSGLSAFLLERRASSFFAFSGKLTAFLGPLLLGVLTEAFDSMRVGISVVLALYGEGVMLTLLIAALGLEPEGTLLLSVGRLSPDKDFPTLLAAMLTGCNGGGVRNVLPRHWKDFNVGFRCAADAPPKTD